MRTIRSTAIRVTAIRTAYAIFATAAAFAALAAPSALAGTYTFAPCGTLGGYSWTPGYGVDNAWAPDSRCPYELAFKAVKPSGPGSESWWTFPPQQYTSQTIDAVQFTISGSNGSAFGVRQGVRACGPSGCGPLISHTDGSTGPEAKSLSVAAGEIPSGANQLQLYGECDLPTNCVQLDPGILLDDILVTFRDETAPELWLYDTPPETNNFPPLVPNGWNSQTRAIWFAVSDTGSGGQSMRTDSQYLADEVSLCNVNPAAPLTDFCPLDSGEMTYLLPTVRQPAGNNVVKLTAYDAAGNVSPEISIPFKVDNVKPPTPSALAAVGATAAGWNTSRSVRLQWTNLSQTVETATESGISAARYDIRPGEDGQTDPPISPIFAGNAINAIDPVTFPADGIWRVAVWTFDRAGNFSNSSSEIFVRIDSVKLGAPVIEPMSWIGGAPSQSSPKVKWARPANVAASKSGICGYAMAVDSQSDGDPGATINVYGDVTSAALPPLPSGRSYLHLRAVSCAGVPGAIAQLPVDADLEPPTISTNAPVGGTWLDESGSLRIEAHDDGSGVAQIEYSVDNEPSRTAPSASVEVPLSEGTHLVNFGASDVAGNTTSVQALTISVDKSPPVGAIDPLDPARPTRVRGVVTDEYSGIAKAWLEYQLFEPGTEAAWRNFGSVISPDIESDDSVTLEARFPDSAVPAGTYRLRIVAYDRAGHLFTGDLRLDGSVAMLMAPLRATPNLTAGFWSSPRVNPASCRKAKRAKTCRRRSRGAVRRLSQRRYLDFGSGVTLDGALTDNRGNPLPDTTLDLYGVGTDRMRRPLGQVVTGADGAYRFLLPPGPSRQIVVHYGGDEMLSARETTARILTYGKATLIVPRKVKSGRTTVFRGRVLGAAADIPARGVLVEIQYKMRGSWLPLISGQTAADGRYSIKYSFARYRTPLRFELRALVRKTSDVWPYETGNSKSDVVMVMP